jgi:hypothetical protein
MNSIQFVNESMQNGCGGQSDSALCRSYHKHSQRRRVHSSCGEGGRVHASRRRQVRLVLLICAALPSSIELLSAAQVLSEVPVHHHNGQRPARRGHPIVLAQGFRPMHHLAFICRYVTTLVSAWRGCYVIQIRDQLGIPVFAMVDSDPYGLKILSVYTTGSKGMSYDSGHLTTSDIKWLGVRAIQGSVGFLFLSYVLS